MTGVAPDGAGPNHAHMQRRVATRWHAFLVLLLVLAPSGCTKGIPVAELFKLTAFQTPGVSMEPTIRHGDVIYADLAYFGTHPPRTGDVVLYKLSYLKNGPNTKRIVALGGSTVEIRDGRLIVDGRVVDEPYLLKGGASTPYSRNWGPGRLPRGCVFLLGDNRDHSQDSRVDGCSSAADLVGLVRYAASSAGPAREVK